MTTTLARIPRRALTGLGDLRAVEGIEVRLDDEAAWLGWPAGSSAVADRLRSIAGVRFYHIDERTGVLREVGKRLPAGDRPPETPAIPLRAVLGIEPFRTRLAVDPEIEPVAARLVRCAEVRPATALRTDLGALAAWAEWAPSDRFAPLRAAACDRDVLVIGAPLPEVLGAERFWGGSVLVPLGWRLDPDLPAATWRATLELRADDLALRDDEGWEIVAGSAFGPLSRAAVRLAREERG